MNRAITADAATIQSPATDIVSGQVTPHALSPAAGKMFLIWTALWWGAAGVCAVAFYTGALDFRDSSRLSLYGISIWLNGWLLAYLAHRATTASKMDLYHDALVIWMLSYAFTNVVWEIPWVIFSPILFVDMNTLDDLLIHTGYMRESMLHMYWWSLGSFASVDLRTINRDPTFYTLEIYAFVNLLTVIYFFYLNKKRSPHRYLVAVIGCGEPVASTFIFSFTEVFADFENMVGGIPDILLALVWTQYQYILFPLIFGYIGYKLLCQDLADSRQQ